VENSTSSNQWSSLQVNWESPQKYPAGKITIRYSVHCWRGGNLIKGLILNKKSWEREDDYDVACYRQSILPYLLLFRNVFLLTYCTLNLWLTVVFFIWSDFHFSIVSYWDIYNLLLPVYHFFELTLSWEIRKLMFSALELSLENALCLHFIVLC